MSEQAQIIFDTVERMDCPSCHAQIDVSSLQTFSQAICPNCGGEVTVPGRLGNYLLLNCLGSGGMGSVYRAYDESLARIVAIKVMLRSLGDAPEFLESFRREAQAAAKLNHPNIAQIYSFGQEKGQPYIVMELVGGQHFDEMIAGPKPLDQALVMKIGMDIADGLQLAAASNLIHGDIKPENILLDERNTAKLLDFGIASTPNTQTTEIWGTPYYIAPEKLKRQRVDFRSDIYCLGGTLYHALTQHPPFEGKDAIAVVKARLKRPPVPMRTFRSDIDPEVEDIIDRMLQIEPAMRYPTYGSLLSDMRRYLRRVQPHMPSASSITNKRIIIKGRGKGAGSASSGSSSANPPSGRHHIAVSRGMVDSKKLTGAYSVQTATKTMQTPPKTVHTAPKTVHMAPKTVHVAPKTVRIVSREENAGIPARKMIGEEDDSSRGGNGASHGGLIAALVVFALLLLATGGVLYFLRSQHKKALADYTAEVGRRNTVLSQFQMLKTAAEKLRDETMSLYMGEAATIVSQAISSVEAEVGSEFTARIVHENPGAKEAEVRPEGAAGAQAQDAADGEKKRRAPDAEGRAAAGEGDSEMASGLAEAPLEGIPLLAREVFEALAPVRRANSRTLHVCDQVAMALANAEAAAQRIASEVSGSTASIRNDAEAAAGVVSGMENDLNATIALYNEAKASVGDLQNDVRQAQAKLRELLGRTSVLAAERKRRAEEEERARLAREAEEARLAEERRAAAERNEQKGRIAQTLAANLETLRAFKYDQVVHTLRRLGDDMTYPESQKALEVAIRRIECLKELKAFLIERMSAIPFTHPSGIWSVKAASDRALEIDFYESNKTRKRIVAWDKVKLEQMIALISFYLSKENIKLLRLLPRVAALRNAAVYYMTFAPDNPTAQAIARQYAEEIIRDLPTRAQEIEELLPELKAAPEGGGL